MSSPSQRPKKKGAKSVAPAEDEAGPPPVDVETLLQAERARLAAEQLAASSAALHELAAEHAALQERARHEEREGREVAALFRAEMAAKAEALAAARAEVAAGAAAQAAAQEAASQREAALHAAFDQERQTLVVAAGALQAQLDAVAQWQHEREEALAAMDRLRRENARIQDEAGEKVRALQRRLYELGHAEGDDAEGGGRPGTSSSGEEGGGDLCLEADLHRLLAQNRRAADEMRQYGQEAEELQREMKALESERAALLRDAELAGEMEAQYAKRGTLQAREIRDQKSKITSLEKGLARMAAEFESEKAALEAGLRAQLADAAAEQNALRRLLQVRTKELRQVRRLAQEVLLQRSEVEAFLVSSIQQVRAEMAAEAAQCAAGSGELASSSSFRADSRAGAALGPALSMAGAAAAPVDRAPSSSSNSSSGRGSQLEAASPTAAAAVAPGALGGSSSTAGGAAGQVDIKQLSWQDRERILRLLFAKINRASQRPVVPAVVRTQALSEAQTEAPPLPPLRGLATETGPAGLA
ncbi:hypothetical protein ABPG75_000689 [Micractinium tetrahymenae]